MWRVTGEVLCFGPSQLLALLISLDTFLYLIRICTYGLDIMIVVFRSGPLSPPGPPYSIYDKSSPVFLRLE